MNSNEIREISTKLTDEKSLEILQSVFGQLSDGIWENSPRMNKYWLNATAQMIDNEVKITVNACSFNKSKYKYYNVANPFYQMFDLKIKEWLANTLKRVVKIEEKDEHASGWWKRDNTRELAYLGYKHHITVADAYKVYDILKERKIAN